MILHLAYILTFKKGVNEGYQKLMMQNVAPDLEFHPKLISGTSRF